MPQNVEKREHRHREFDVMRNLYRWVKRMMMPPTILNTASPSVCARPK